MLSSSTSSSLNTSSSESNPLPDLFSTSSSLVDPSNAPFSPSHHPLYQEQNHPFQWKTYTSPTLCDICHKLLWGFLKQGLHCQECHQNVHLKCLKLVLPCPDTTFHSTKSLPKKNSSNHFQKLKEKLKEKNQFYTVSFDDVFLSSSDSENDPVKYPSTLNQPYATTKLMTSSNDTIHSNDPNSPSSDIHSWKGLVRRRSNSNPSNLVSKSDPGSTSKNPFPKMISPTSHTTMSKKSNLLDVMNEVLISTSRHAARLETNRHEPSLNLLTTTPKNMSRFVLRVGGLKRGEAQIKRILTWQDHKASLMALLLYTFICLYPIISIILPLVLICQHLIVQYYERFKEKAVPATSTLNDSDHSKSIKDPAPKLKPVEYKENLQFIQNSMGMFCDVYDTVTLFARQYFSWEYPDKTMLCLKILLASIFPIYLIITHVPFNYLALGFGWFIFLGNTPFVLAVRDVVLPFLFDILNHQWEFAKGVAKQWPEGILSKHDSLVELDSPSQKYPSQGTDDIIKLSIYENQRWWLGLGFLNYLLTSERSAWSDLKGQIPFPPKDSYVPPPTFRFLEPEWLLDDQWASVPADKDGWVYSDHVWGSPKSKSGIGTLTRRRKWIRHVVRIQGNRMTGELKDVEPTHSRNKAFASDEKKCSYSGTSNGSPVQSFSEHQLIHGAAQSNKIQVPTPPSSAPVTPSSESPVKLPGSPSIATPVRPPRESDSFDYPPQRSSSNKRGAQKISDPPSLSTLSVLSNESTEEFRRVISPEMVQLIREVNAK